MFVITNDLFLLLPPYSFDFRIIRNGSASLTMEHYTVWSWRLGAPATTLVTDLVSSHGKKDGQAKQDHHLLFAHPTSLESCDMIYVSVSRCCVYSTPLPLPRILVLKVGSHSTHCIFGSWVMINITDPSDISVRHIN